MPAFATAVVMDHRPIAPVRSVSTSPALPAPRPSPDSIRSPSDMPRQIDILQLVRDEARRRGVRWTNQRQTIVDTFIGCAEHITVEELHRRVRQIDRSVSAATVYRTVNMLVDLGVAHKRNFGSGSASFESAINKEHHDHLVCVACGVIHEFHHDRIESLQEEIAETHGFRLHHHRMELYGVCAECTRKGVTSPAVVSPARPEAPAETGS